MKRLQLLNTAFITASLLFLLTAGTITNAQNRTKHNGTEDAIVNLLTGINSDNYGLQRSSLYFAGKYKLEEAVPDVVDLLQSTKDNRIKILAARVLYEIGNCNGLKAVRTTALRDSSERVKRICTAIYNTYTLGTDVKYYAKSK